MAQLLSSQNGRAWLATGALCVGWLGVCRVAGKALPPTLSRKLVHIGAWPNGASPCSPARIPASFGLPPLACAPCGPNVAR